MANPGCYPTCSQLPLYPLVKLGLISTEDLIIDAKSGEAVRQTEAAVEEAEFELLKWPLEGWLFCGSLGHTASSTELCSLCAC